MQDAKMQEASGNGPDQSPKESHTNRKEESCALLFPQMWI